MKQADEMLLRINLPFPPNNFIAMTATFLSDSQVHPSHRKSESTDFPLIPEWRLSQRAEKSHDRKVDMVIHCISAIVYIYV